MELKNGYFGGSTSFMTNGYVIWQKGLAGDDGKRMPNPYAIKQGNTYVQRMLYVRSKDVRSSFYKLIEYLKQIQRKESKKEKDFIIFQLKNSSINTLSKQYQAIQTAINNDNFGMAYTLLLKTSEEYKELVEEFHSGKFKNISHTKSFWNSQFSTYFAKRLDEALEIQGDQLVNKISNNSLTIDQIVEDFINEQIRGSEGVAVGSLNEIKDQLKTDLARELTKYGIISNNSIFDNIFQSSNKFAAISSRTSLKTKTGRNRKLETVVKNIADDLATSVGLGLSTEIEAVGRQGRQSTLTFSTGNMTKRFTKALSGKEQNVKQKADTVSFSLYEGNLDIKRIATNIFGESMETSQEKMEAFIEEIKRTAGLKDKIFMVSTNIKGYRSKFDLKIAKEATYKQRAADIAKLALEAEGMPSLSMEKLIFLFNNTMKGCIAASESDKISEYVAAVCAAWLWDDYGELLSTQEREGPIQKIHMFNSGGIYYSASQLIGKSIQQLYEGTSGNFVAVEFKPATFDAQDFYNQLRTNYPMPDRNVSVEEWQGQLKKRWDEMKDRVERESKMSISIRQKELEKILGDLSQYL